MTSTGRNRKNHWIGLLFIVVLTFMFSVYPAQTVVSNMPPRPLDPPPVPEPTPEPTPPPPPTHTFIQGAFIQLNVIGGEAETFTMMQWQDGLGNWHDIGGWRGQLYQGQWIRWWLPDTLLGLGPFRWLVYEQPEGGLLAISSEFDMPVRHGQFTYVTVDITP